MKTYDFSSNGEKGHYYITNDGDIVDNLEDVEQVGTAVARVVVDGFYVGSPDEQRASALKQYRAAVLAAKGKTAKDLFDLNILATRGRYSLIGDGSERFWVTASSLKEEIAADDQSNLVEEYDNWCVRARTGADLQDRVIFDNAGGITLQLTTGYAHAYNDVRHAAADYIDYADDGDTSDWDGHEDAAADLDPTQEQIRNGGYRIWIAGDSHDDIDGWGNVDDFFAIID